MYDSSSQTKTSGPASTTGTLVKLSVIWSDASFTFAHGSIGRAVSVKTTPFSISEVPGVYVGCSINRLSKEPSPGDVHSKDA